MTAFDNNEFEKYKDEVREKWGQTEAYKEHTEKTKDYSKEKWNNLTEGMNDILAEFSECMKNGDDPNSPKSQNLVGKLQKYITEN